jgi:CRP/FNR family transcriptional regulator, cyclic AMP receptor protein
MKETGYLKESQELIKDLMKIPVLSPLKERDIKNLIKMSKIRTYDAGEVICEEGLNDKWIYFLTKGRVRILKAGKELSVLEKTGEIFGEMSVIDGGSRSASVHALETTVCLATDTLYIDKLQDHEKMAFRYLLYRIFAEILSARLRESNEELVQAKTRFGSAAIKRIADRLLS